MPHFEGILKTGFHKDLIMKLNVSMFNIIFDKTADLNYLT